uniref:Uncharacterized protein n=1 Tax=Oryza brachyantha TaxID=4533 RepID=J3MV14_ORYBR
MDLGSHAAPARAPDLHKILLAARGEETKEGESDGQREEEEKTGRGCRLSAISVFPRGQRQGCSTASKPPIVSFFREISENAFLQTKIVYAKKMEPLVSVVEIMDDVVVLTMMAASMTPFSKLIGSLAFVLFFSVVAGLVRMRDLKWTFFNEKCFWAVLL